MITTKGFRDIIEIGRQRRPEIYNLFFDKPKPIVPRKLGYEIDERVDSNGNILRKPNTRELDKIIDKIKKNDVKTIAVSLINSYANSANELAIKKYIHDKIPNIDICISCEVDNEYREYERTSTTVINAVLIPIVRDYIKELTNIIKKYFDCAEFAIMKSDGGVSSSFYVIRLPISIIESGPAAGVIATRFIGQIIREKNLISFDMGGTTAKSGTIIEGAPSIATEYEVGGKIHAGRIIKGSGYPVRYSFIDLAEISSGGGSIIWLDAAGALKVGPISAGSDPGPACYARGGKKPTITDAHLILVVL